MLFVVFERTLVCGGVVLFFQTKTWTSVSILSKAENTKKMYNVVHSSALSSETRNLYNLFISQQHFN